MPLRKAVLEGNDTLKANQRFLVDGLVASNILYLTRDPLEISIGVVELPDQTRIPGGRKRAGEFGLTLQFARDQDREEYNRWFEACTDFEEFGVHPEYKRDATIIYYRLFQGRPNRADTGTEARPVQARVYGVWVSQLNFPDYDMNADEGDGSCILEVTMQFDSAELLTPDNTSIRTTFDRRETVQNVRA